MNDSRISDSVVRLSPEVPAAVRLPAWLKLDGLAPLERLEAIRAEAAATEAAFIEAAAVLRDVFERMLVVTNAAYVAATPHYWGERDDAPPDVMYAIGEAVGAHRLDYLQGWLTGLIGDCSVMFDEDREAAFKDLGQPVDWTGELQARSDELAGRGV